MLEVEAVEATEYVLCRRLDYGATESVLVNQSVSQLGP